MNAGVGSLSLLQEIFLTQESNPGPLHCKWILYQLSYEGSPTSWRSAQLCILWWFPMSFPRVTYGHLHQWLYTGERELLRHFNNPYRSELTVIPEDVKSKVFHVRMKIPRPCLQRFSKSGVGPGIWICSKYLERFWCRWLGNHTLRNINIMGANSVDMDSRTGKWYSYFGI